MSKERALEMFPMLKRDKLKGKNVIFSFKTRPKDETQIGGQTGGMIS